MPTTKTATLTFRIDPGMKEALRTAAQHEHRSIANMVEVLILDWCSRNGIVIPKQDSLLDGGRRQPVEAPADIRRGKRDGDE